MSKRTLVEVNAFAKLLSFFYDQKSKGNDNDVVQKVVTKANSSDVQRAYDAWKRDNEKLLLSTRNLLLKADLSTADVDALLKKYHNY
jgi:hypothetical protein